LNPLSITPAIPDDDNDNDNEDEDEDDDEERRVTKKTRRSLIDSANLAWPSLASDQTDRPTDRPTDLLLSIQYGGL
jgi:hypothetical protein